jgi:hypothetical protein
MQIVIVEGPLDWPYSIGLVERRRVVETDGDDAQRHRGGCRHA